MMSADYGRAPQGRAAEDPGLLDNPVENPVVLGSAACCLIFTAVFAAFSLGAVPPLTYGIRYNLFNKQADTENVMGPGRYFIGPWNTFLLFPASVQTIEFTSEPRLSASGLRFPALHSRTKEGLALHLQVSLQYQLKFDQVGQLYNEFNNNYENMFTSTIRDTLIRAASDYEAYQLWEERAAVGERMQHMVDTALKRTYADCWGLQLMIIELPDLFEKSIVRTQVAKQQISTQEFAQAATLVRAHTSVIQAQFDKRVTVIKAHGHANYTFITKKAAAEARFNTLGIEGKIIESIKNKLQLNGAELIQYQRFSAVQYLQNASVLYGFDENTNVLMAQGARNAAATPTNIGDSPAPKHAPSGDSSQQVKMPSSIHSTPSQGGHAGEL